jgi:hypothetical protein
MASCPKRRVPLQVGGKQPLVHVGNQGRLSAAIDSIGGLCEGRFAAAPEPLKQLAFAALSLSKRGLFFADSTAKVVRRSTVPRWRLKASPPRGCVHEPARRRWLEPAPERHEATDICAT